MTRTLIALIVVGVAFIAASPRAQKPLAFEVASVKANTSGAEQMIISTPPSGLVRATNVSTRFLMRFAYDMPEFLIMNAPNWSVTDHFDIVAKAPAHGSLADFRLMFRALLAERFALASHTELREMMADVLTTERSGVLGRNLTVSAQRCEPPDTCGVRPAFGRMEGKDATMRELAASLTVMSRRVVVDATGLNSRYNFSLMYTPDAITLQPALRAQFPTIDPDGPSLATALREQLGLRMQSKFQKVDVLVIDHVEKPTPD
jgi:uncharacterized protein (TIGR03435 family)